MSRKRLPTEASPPPLDSALVIAPYDDPDTFYQALVDNKILQLIAGFEFSPKRHGFVIRLPFRGEVIEKFKFIAKGLSSAGFQVFAYNARKDVLVDPMVPQIIFRGVPNKILDEIFLLWPEGTSFSSLQTSTKDVICKKLVSDGVPLKIWRFGYKPEAKFSSLIYHFGDWEEMFKTQVSGLNIPTWGFKHGLPHISHFDVFPPKDHPISCCSGSKFHMSDCEVLKKTRVLQTVVLQEEMLKRFNINGHPLLLDIGSLERDLFLLDKDFLIEEAKVELPEEDKFEVLDEIMVEHLDSMSPQTRSPEKLQQTLEESFKLINNRPSSYSSQGPASAQCGGGRGKTLIPRTKFSPKFWGFLNDEDSKYGAMDVPGDGDCAIHCLRKFNLLKDLSNEEFKSILLNFTQTTDWTHLGIIKEFALSPLLEDADSNWFDVETLLTAALYLQINLRIKYWKWSEDRLLLEFTGPTYVILFHHYNSMKKEDGNHFSPLFLVSKKCSVPKNPSKFAKGLVDSKMKALSQPSYCLLDSTSHRSLKELEFQSYYGKKSMVSPLFL